MRRRIGTFTPAAPLTMRNKRRLLPFVLLAALTGAACSSDAWNDPALGVPYVPHVKSARHVGQLFEEASPALPIADGGASMATLTRSFWLVGELRHGLSRRQKRVGPAFVVTEARDWPCTEPLEVIPATVPLPNDAVVRWTAGIDIGDAQLLYYAAVRPGAAGEAALDYLGTGVARFADGALTAVNDGTDWRFFGRGDPAFGSAVIQADHGITTGMDYVFGVRGDAGTDRAYVARVPHGRGAERDAYTFLDADGTWSNSVKDAAPLFRAGAGGLSVSWNEHLGGFLAVYAWEVAGGDGDDEDAARLRVVARTARHPSGPWSDETPLFDAPGAHAGGRVRLGHGAREHPQVSLHGGRVIFVTVDGGGEASRWAGARPGTAAPRPPRVWRVEFPSVHLREERTRK
jgi:hypothetical protein